MIKRRAPAQGNEKPVKDVAAEKMAAYVHETREALKEEMLEDAKEAGDLKKIKQRVTDERGRLVETPTYIETHAIGRYLDQIRHNLVWKNRKIQ